jgi:hypothetical protein
MVIDICKNLCTLCPLYRPEQGNIVGREYINFCKFLLPYGISLSDSTIGHKRTYRTILELSDHALFKIVNPATSEAGARWPRRGGGRLKNMDLWGPFHLKSPLVHDSNLIYVAFVLP